MKKFVVALTALTALAAAPAMARSDTHISFGFYSPAPAPVYYEPAPVVYYPPVHNVYYAPPRPYAYGYGRPYRGWEHRREFQSAWNGPGWNAPRYDGRGHCGR